MKHRIPADRHVRDEIRAVTERPGRERFWAFECSAPLQVVRL